VNQHLKKNEVYLGDCLELMPNIKPASIDLIICDLPYKALAFKWDSLIPFDLLWSEYKRILKPTGTVLLFASGKFFQTCLLSNQEWFRYDIIWHKNNATNFANAKLMPMRTHEKILVYAKPGTQKQTTYNPQGLKPYNRSRKKAEENIGQGYQKKSLTNNYVQTLTGYPGDVINYPVERPSFHPCQKPLELIKHLVLTYSNKGDIILDNASGSGNVALACKELNRNFILIEKEKEYYDIILKRLSEEK
jgi:site-specific DNA-methyltransferase (adenine-specific)